MSADSTPESKTIEFKVQDKVGSLMNALQVFSVSLEHHKCTVYFSLCSENCYYRTRSNYFIERVQYIADNEQQPETIE